MWLSLYFALLRLGAMLFTEALKVPCAPADLPRSQGASQGVLLTFYIFIFFFLSSYLVMKKSEVVCQCSVDVL